MVADDPDRDRGRHAVARRALPRMRHKPRDRYPHNRPSPAGVRRIVGARAAVLYVPGHGANAVDPWLARLPAGRAVHVDARLIMAKRSSNCFASHALVALSTSTMRVSLASRLSGNRSTCAFNVERRATRLSIFRQWGSARRAGVRWSAR